MPIFWVIVCDIGFYQRVKSAAYRDRYPDIAQFKL